MDARRSGFVTKSGNLKQPTRQYAIDWVSAAWKSIKTETIVHSFLVCGISNALDGSEDGLASRDIPKIRESQQEDDGESSSDHPDEEIDDQE